MSVLYTGMGWFPQQPGGLDRYLHGMLERAPAHGLGGSAVVVAERSPDLEAFPVPVTPAAPATSPLRERLSAVRRAARSGLANAHIANAHFALYAHPWLRDLQDTPLVVHFHGPWADEMATESPGPRGRLRAAFAHRVERAVYRRADRVITLSEAFRDVVHRRYGVPLERVRVVPGGVSLEPYLAAPDRAQARVQLDWPQSRPILLAVRRLARRMGLENLIDAVALVRQAHPEVLLYIGGKGPLAADLEARVREGGLADSVRLLGFLPDADLPLAYAAADLTVVPTAALEGFGLITVESLASGTPVFGTPVGGTPEILKGLEPGLVFEAATPRAMADRLVAALSGELNLPRPADCRAHTVRYGWDDVLPRVRAVFEEVA